MRQGSTGLFYKGSHTVLQGSCTGFHEEGVHKAEVLQGSTVPQGPQMFYKGSTRVPRFAVAAKPNVFKTRPKTIGVRKYVVLGKTPVWDT